MCALGPQCLLAVVSTERSPERSRTSGLQRKDCEDALANLQDQLLACFYVIWDVCSDVIGQGLPSGRAYL